MGVVRRRRTVGLDGRRFVVRRGDIVLVDLEPVRGSEADKRRPCVVVSNDGANERATQLGRGTVTVVPLTTNTRHVHPFQVVLAAASTGLRADSKAQAEQVRSLAVERIGRRVGTLPVGVLAEVDAALRVHLGL